MRFIYREDIEIEKWDTLVKSNSGNSVFSLSVYLDSVAENWCVWVDGDYSKGIAIPFTVRLGIKICYTPIFVRYMEWFGEKGISYENAIPIIKSQFKQGNFNVKEAFDSSFSQELIYQSILPDQIPKYNSQAKRMFTKYEQSAMQIIESKDEKEILDIIHAELPQKIASINDSSLISLKKLISGFKKQGILKIIVVKDKENIVGGLFLIDFNSTVLYLKGAFSKESKKEGAMYGLMHESIESAIKRQKTFDFGGSRVEGVRRFNVNLGGHDRVYYSYEWDNGPFWFKWLKIARKAWRKR